MIHLEWSKCEQKEMPGIHVLADSFIIHDLGTSGICIQHVEGNGSVEEADALVEEINLLLFGDRHGSGYSLGAEIPITRAGHHACSLSKPANQDQRTFCAWFHSQPTLLHRFLDKVEELKNEDTVEQM